MIKPTFQVNWPASWKTSYTYDLMEVYGELSNIGYSYAYSVRYKATISLVKKVALPGSKILDVAAAQGNFSLSLAELGYKVTWNDLRKELADYVVLKHGYGDICYLPGNIFEFELSEQFDVVLIAEIIEHVAHPDEFLKKISQLVKPGGYVVMSTPNGEYCRHNMPRFTECQDPSQYEKVQFSPNADGHIFLLHVDEIYTLAKQAGLLVQEIRLFNNLLTNGHLKTKVLLNVLPRGLVERIENFTQSLPNQIGKRAHSNLAVLLFRPTESN